MIWEGLLCLAGELVSKVEYKKVVMVIRYCKASTIKQR